MVADQNSGAQPSGADPHSSQSSKMPQDPKTPQSGSSSQNGNSAKTNSPNSGAGLGGASISSPKAKQIVQQARTYKPESWDLSSLGVGDVKSGIDALEQSLGQFEQYAAELDPNLSPARFHEILKDYEALMAQSRKLSCYAMMRSDEKSTDPQCSADAALVNNFMAGYSNRTLFFRNWFENIATDGHADTLIQGSPDYGHFLRRMRDLKQFSLPPEQEGTITMKDANGLNAILEMRAKICSLMRFPFQGKELTESEMRPPMEDEDPAVREEAYRSVLEAYEKQKSVLATAYTARVNDWREEHVRSRGYASPISVRNESNDISDTSVKALMKVVEKNFPVFQEYFELKRQALGLDTLSRYDIYAKLPGNVNKVSYDDSVNYVLDAYRDFRPDFADALQAVLDAKHVHAEPGEDKRGGAYCLDAGTSLLPFILMSWRDLARDRQTFAHEGGHAIHDIFAARNNEFSAHPSLPLAETASTFCETLVVQKQLREGGGDKKNLLVNLLDDLYATIPRQVSFVLFEEKAHKMIEEGKTVDELCQVYLEDLRAQLGPAIEVDDLFQNEWLRVPHLIRSPFYCYSYSFGNLLALGLYQEYLEQGESFSANIKELFAKGGSASTDEIVSSVGLNASDEAFWEKCFDYIRGLVNELRQELDPSP